MTLCRSMLLSVLTLLSRCNYNYWPYALCKEKNIQATFFSITSLYLQAMINITNGETKGLSNIIKITTLLNQVFFYMRLIEHAENKGWIINSPHIQQWIFKCSCNILFLFFFYENLKQLRKILNNYPIRIIIWHSRIVIHYPMTWL